MLKAALPLLIALLLPSLTVMAAAGDNTDPTPSGGIALGQSLYAAPASSVKGTVTETSPAAAAAPVPSIASVAPVPTPPATVASTPVDTPPSNPPMIETSGARNTAVARDHLVAPGNNDDNKGEPDEYFRWNNGHSGIKYNDMVIGAVTLVLAIFTGFLWLSTRSLWRETRAGGRTAETSARAAEKSAEAARASVDAAIAAERPRWVVSSMRLLLNDMSPSLEDRTGVVEVTLLNLGRTAAEIIRIALKPTLAFNLEPKPRYPLGLAKTPVQFSDVVSNGETYTFREPVHLTGQQVRDLMEERTNLFAYGYVAYRDFLDEHWEKGFVGMLDMTTPNGYPIMGSPSEGNGGGLFIQPPAEAELQAYTYTVGDAMRAAQASGI